MRPAGSSSLDPFGAVEAQRPPDPRILDAAYKAAAEETWRKKLAHDWRATEIEDWSVRSARPDRLS